MIHAYAPEQASGPSGPSPRPIGDRAEPTSFDPRAAASDVGGSPGDTPVATTAFGLRLRSGLGAASMAGCRFGGIPRSRVLLAMNQLAVMSNNGVEIAEALESVAGHCRDRKLAEVLSRIHDSVNQGNAFSTAMAAHGDCFPATLPPLLVAAEASGEVPETLEQACTRLREELETRGTILSAMIYPVILIAASTVVMTALILGVLPQFGKVFASIGKPIPPSTANLLALGDFCRNHWLFLLSALSGMLASLFVLRHHPMIRRPLGRFLMYGPLIRDAYRPLVAGRMLRTIAAMVRGGVPLLQAIGLATRTTGDVYWQALLAGIEQKLIDGLNASSAMAEADFLPPEAAQMMATAEKTGRVGEVLEDVGTFYEREGARRIKRLVIGLEPAIILVMGIIVAGVVMSVMLPLLDVSTIGS
jgi:type II secretory pathway component PulF